MSDTESQLFELLPKAAGIMEEKLRSNGCDKYREQLFDYIGDDELRGTDQYKEKWGELEEHIASCPACHDELNACRCLVTSIPNAALVPPPELYNNIMSTVKAEAPARRRAARFGTLRYVAQAAAAIAVIFGVYAAVRMTNLLNTNNLSINKSKEDSLRTSYNYLGGHDDEGFDDYQYEHALETPINQETYSSPCSDSCEVDDECATTGVADDINVIDNNQNISNEDSYELEDIDDPSKMLLLNDVYFGTDTLIDTNDQSQVSEFVDSLNHYAAVQFEAHGGNYAASYCFIAYVADASLDLIDNICNEFGLSSTNGEYIITDYDEDLAKDIFYCFRKNGISFSTDLIGDETDTPMALAVFVLNE
jgi:hypothetical protein